MKQKKLVFALFCALTAPAVMANQNQTIDSESYPVVDGGPLNYDTQNLEIFRAASGHGGPVQPEWRFADTPTARAALERIYRALQNRQMFLKNAVWRPDLKVIRLTWANNDNSLVFKTVYRVNEDPALRNSVYADKTQVLDIKIMYLDGDHYRYIHLDHAPQRIGGWEFRPSGEDPAQNRVFGVYTVNGSPSKQECAFCHMLVPGVNGKPGGVFYPRYQESFLAGKYHMKYPDMFDFASFKEIDRKGAPIKLPDALPQKILFRQVSVQDGPQIAVFARTMFESPEIFEAFARDNHKTMCMSVKFPDNAKHIFGSDNYVCADNQKKMLYVNYHNAMLSTGSGHIHYSIPYYKDTEHTAATMRPSPGGKAN